MFHGSAGWLSLKLPGMSSDSIDDLFARTLLGDYDDDAPWEAIRALQNLGTRTVFERAANWCGSDDPKKRTRGADVLALLGKTVLNSSVLYADESFRILTAALTRETHPQSLASILAAFGHLENTQAVPLIAPFRDHPDKDVRFGAAFALGCFPNEPEAVTALLHLMRDQDSDVRDWATFGLGVLGNTDSEQVREALFRNLSDNDEDVREEAMVGLAKRKDRRVVPAILRELQMPNPSDRIFESANELTGIDIASDSGKRSECFRVLKEMSQL